MKSYLPFSLSNPSFIFAFMQNCLEKADSEYIQLKLTSQTGKVLIKAKIILAVSLIIFKELTYLSGQ